MLRLRLYQTQSTTMMIVHRHLGLQAGKLCHVHGQEGMGEGGG